MERASCLSSIPSGSVLESKEEKDRERTVLTLDKSLFNRDNGGGG